MKKILLLGGSSQQVVAIKTAKQVGCYTILCDYLKDNPGQFVADKFYLTSTTDKNSVLRIAQDERIDAIVAYSSDPAAPTAAYVSEKIGLPGVPYETAKSFCEKHLFRSFLMKNGFHVPMSQEIDGTSTSDVLEGMRYPIIVKPTDSSGSKGVTVITDATQFDKARDDAAKYSRNGVLIAEEFIVRDHPHVIEAEIFVVDGKVSVWGLINSIRDKNTNPLLPAAYSYPISLTPERVELVKKEVSRLVECSHVSMGAFNIEMIITKENCLYFLDAGPRNGGNMLPEFIGGIKQQDLVMATILAALGEREAIGGITLDGQEGGFWGLSVLHSSKPGIFEGVTYSPEARACLFREHLFIKLGDFTDSFNMSRDAVGLAFFRFPSLELRDQILGDFNGKHIEIHVRVSE